MRATTVAFMVVIAFSACGDGAQDLQSVEEVADAIGCNDLDVGSDEIFVREGGDCEFDGERLAIYTFDNDDAQSQWLDIAKEFGGVYVVGDRWIVSVDSQSTAEVIQEEIGGEVQ